MTDILQGADAQLVVTFYEYAGGPAVDVDDLQLLVSDALGDPVAGFPIEVDDLVHLATGVYAYTWAVPDDQAAGVYAAVWSGTDAQDEDVQASEVLTVVDDGVDAGTTWATTSQVEDLTGETVTGAQVRRAQAVVDLFAGRTPLAADAIGPRDLATLRSVLAFQTVWQRTQPGYLTRLSAVTSVQQDGLAVQYASEAAILLAPLALRALRNLSWMGNRALQLTRGDTRPAPAFNTEPSDALHPWEPL